MTDELSPSQLADAERMGLTPEEYRGFLAQQEAAAAAQIGLTREEFRELKAAAERAAARGYGVNIAEWAAATNRDQHGRKKAPPQ